MSCRDLQSQLQNSTCPAMSSFVTPISWLLVLASSFIARPCRDHNFIDSKHRQRGLFQPLFRPFSPDQPNRWLIANALCADYFAVYFALARRFSLYFPFSLVFFSCAESVSPARVFILNFCHSAMSIFGFGALQIGCFSTKMQHLLP